MGREESRDGPTGGSPALFKNNPLHNKFSDQFWRFLAAPASIFANSGAKMGVRRVDFRCFFEKRDFLKIELSMVIWPHFEGRTLQKSVPRATPNGNGAKKC